VAFYYRIQPVALSTLVSELYAVALVDPTHLSSSPRALAFATAYIRYASATEPRIPVGLAGGFEAELWFSAVAKLHNFLPIEAYPDMDYR
jgi:hypothetical protein